MNPGTRRTLMLTLLALGAAALAFLIVSNAITLEQFKQRREELLAVVEAAPVTFVALFFLAFSVLAAFAPGTSLFKIAAGALFGLAGGFALSLAACVAAATIGFLTARYLARGWTERRFHSRVAAINRGVAREGVVFLLAMRFNPLVPFVLINIFMGLTRMKLWKFMATSFVGVIPASFVYTNAGTELARIESSSDILSIRLLGSLVLLSIMPLVGRWAATRLRRARGIAEDAGDV